MGVPDIRNLENCMEDARRAALDQDPGPADPIDYDQLRGRLRASEPKLPPTYQDAFARSYINASCT
jgi:hypothetical protein